MPFLPYASSPVYPIAVAKGGTGSTTQNFVDLTTNQTIAGAKTFGGATTIDNTLTVAGSSLNMLTIQGSGSAVQFYLQNTNAYSTGNYMDFTLAANTSTGIRSAFEFQTNWSNVTDATRTSNVNLQTANNGTFGTVLNFNGSTSNFYGNILPNANNTLSLGSSSLYWSDTYTSTLYLNSTAYLSGGTAGVIGVTGTITLPSTASALYKINAGTVSMLVFDQNKSNFGLGTDTFNSLTYGTGKNNVGVGSYALYALTTGAFNTAVGQGALQNMTAGQFNTGVGQAALPNASLGSYNVGIGAQTGADATGSYNIFIGYAAGYNTTASNTLLVGNIQQSSAANDTAYSLLYGTFSGSAASLTGQQLTVNGKLNINTGSEAIGTAVLVAGTVTVSTTAVTASSIIMLTRQVTGGTVGELAIGTITAGTSFVINSASSTDTSTVGYLIIN